MDNNACGVHLHQLFNSLSEKYLMAKKDVEEESLEAKEVVWSPDIQQKKRDCTHESHNFDH